jgi:multiple sugar transport system permease protein
MRTLELPRTVTAVRGKRTRRRAKWDRMAILFLLPWIAHVLIFWAYPLYRAVYGSVSDWNILTDETTYVGFVHYRELLHDHFFFQTLKNTGVYLIIQVPLSIALGIFVATLLNQKLPGWQVFRAIYFLPLIVPVVTLAIVWRAMYGTETGILNYGLSWFGIGRVPWLTSTLWSMPSISLMKVWTDVGFYAVIFLAGLQNVPGETVDAAKVDGANDWHAFWDVKLPMLNPVLIFSVIMGTLWAMQVFAEPLLMTEGGPSGSSTSTLLFLYRQGFDFSRLGFASAGGVVIGILILVLVAFERKLLTREF